MRTILLRTGVLLALFFAGAFLLANSEVQDPQAQFIVLGLAVMTLVIAGSVRPGAVTELRERIRKRTTK